MNHSSIIIICGGFATFVVNVVAAAADANVGDMAAAIGDSVDAVVESVLFSSVFRLSSFGNVCAANCHFEDTDGSPTR